MGRFSRALAVGQPVRNTTQTRDAIRGFASGGGTDENLANQTVVWVKDSPERFEPRVVTTMPLDGTHVAVTNGFRKPGDRVVVRAATLVNQVR